MEENLNINPDEKLTASTSIKIKNNTSATVSVENWTVGFVFLIDTVNIQGHAEGRVKAEYVWYDFRAKDMNNNIIATIKGVYFNRTVILSQNADGSYSLSTEK